MSETKVSVSSKTKNSDAAKTGSIKISNKSAKKLKNMDSKQERDPRFPNKDTEFINGTFNVKTARKYLKEYISNVLNYKLGSINSQYAYAACAELLTLYLVRACGRYNVQNSSKAGLYEITVENLQRGIRESRDFGVDIRELSNQYNTGLTLDYTANLFVDTKTLKAYIERNAFANTTNIDIDNKSLNFICYIVSHGLALLTKTACIMCEFANKKNIQVKTFKYAAQVHFTKELGDLIAQRITEIEGLLANRKEQKENEENQDNNDAEDSAEDSADDNADDNANDSAEDSD